MIDINTALGMVERPLQVGDWVVLVDPQPRGLSQLTTDLLCKLEWPRRLTGVPDRYSAFVDGCSECCDSSRFRRYDPPRDDVAELREKLADVTRERDETKRIAHLESTVRNYQSAANKIAVELNEVTSERDTLREQLATAQAEAAAMRCAVEAALKLTVQYERPRSNDGYQFSNHVTLLCRDALKPTAGSDHKRDAELCRELRALLPQSGYQIGMTIGSVRVECIDPQKLFDLLISIRDGGAT